MKCFIDFICFIFLIFMVLGGCKYRNDFPELKGPYLGQKPPGKTPEIFAPEIISTCYSESGIAFCPNGEELFLWLMEPRPYCTILWMKEEKKQWNTLQVFPSCGKYIDGKMTVSPDGKKFLFSSNRPRKMGEEPLDNWDIYFVERTQTGWGKPTHFDSNINTDWQDYYPSMAENGNLYFFSDRDEGEGEDDIYFSQYTDGSYAQPKNVGPSINSHLNEGDPYIEPDESYMIFCSRDRKTGFGNNDLYISFRKNDGSWVKAKNMGKTINTTAEEVCPFVSYDGKYFFFSSNRKKNQTHPEVPFTYKQIKKALNGPGNGSNDIYWVGAKIIEDLKPNYLK